MTRLFTVLVAALTLAGVASAAAAPPGPLRWTPAQVRAAIDTPSTTLYGTVATGTVTHAAFAMRDRVASSCRASGSAFSCALTYSILGQKTTSTFWVRPWSSKTMCVSQKSIAMCPPPMPATRLANDPRDCYGNADLAGCVVRNAAHAIIGQRRADGFITEANLTCEATSSWLRYRCGWNGANGVGTVTFAPSKAGWTTTVTTND